jgi:hypothetical protein
MNPQDVINWLSKGFQEPRHVMTFVCHNARSEEFRIEVFDAGEGTGNRRYVCTASKQGTSKTGNAAATVEEALEEVHWNEL